MAEPWQEIAREMGTFDMTEDFVCYEKVCEMTKQPDDYPGEWTEAAPACKRIAQLQEANAKLEAALGDILTAFDANTILHPDRKGTGPNYTAEFVSAIVWATEAARKATGGANA